MCYIYCRVNFIHLVMVRGSSYYISLLNISNIGMYGQLGHGDQDKRTIPCLVQALADKPVYLVSCGSSHTVSGVSIEFYVYI